MERWRILHKESNFTIIDNGIFQDKDLTLAEVGFLCTILSLPDDWGFSVKGMVKRVQNGRDSTYAVVNRLIEHGYCKREKLIDQKTGRVKGYDYTFYEVKNGQGCASAPLPDYPDTDSPDTDFPDTEKPDNTKNYNKKVLKEVSTKVKSVFVPPTIEEVKAFWKEKNYQSDPELFWGHFYNCDWRLSNGRGAKMKSWKVAAVNWEKTELKMYPRSYGK